jgi:HAE1 family hydrophobic/amphiphilic exporter-1
MDFSTAFGEKGVTINIYGNDLNLLSQAAAQTAAVMGGVEGIESVSDGLEDATPVLIVTVDKDKAMAQGLTVAQVYMAVSAALTSASSASTLEVTDGAYGITVFDPQAADISIDDVAQLLLTATTSQGRKRRCRLGISRRSLTGNR